MERLWKFRGNYVKERHHIGSAVCWPLARWLLVSVIHFINMAFSLVRWRMNDIFIRWWHFCSLNSVKIQAFPTNETVSVEKWDCGEIEHLSLDALRPLSKTYRKLYQMVFCARLHGKINISDWSEKNEQSRKNHKCLNKSNRFLWICNTILGLYPCKNSWDKDDCARFQELTVGKMFKVDIRNIRCDADNNYVAEVVLITPNNINISEVLIRESRANYL